MVMGTSGQPSPAGPPKDVDKEMAKMCHLSALAGMLACGLAAPLGPLLVWAAKREQSPFIDFHGKEALNFHLTHWVPVVLLMLLGFISTAMLFFPALVLIYTAVMSIVASNKAEAGEYYRYPGTFRLIQ